MRHLRFEWMSDLNAESRRKWCCCVDNQPHHGISSVFSTSSVDEKLIGSWHVEKLYKNRLLFSVLPPSHCIFLFFFSFFNRFFLYFLFTFLPFSLYSLSLVRSTNCQFLTFLLFWRLLSMTWRRGGNFSAKLSFLFSLSKMEDKLGFSSKTLRCRPKPKVKYFNEVLSFWKFLLWRGEGGGEEKVREGARGNGRGKVNDCCQ